MTDHFHERFDIPLDLETVRQRFVVRLDNLVLHQFVRTYLTTVEYPRLGEYVATCLGDPATKDYLEWVRARGDFFTHLKVIEAIHQYFTRRTSWTAARELSAIVDQILEHYNELDIGLRWQDGKFNKKGAELLDNKLLNEPLRWLRETGHKTVVAPFEKALVDLLTFEAHEGRRADVVTDAYEALEAMAKIVTGRQDYDLSKNQELFLSKVEASNEYKQLMKDYIEYANRFRHAAKEERPKPAITEREVESFVYLTGLFIRLAMD